MRTFLLLCVIALLGTGCRVLNPSIMFKTKQSHKYTELNDSTFTKQYKIVNNDQVEFRLYSNFGAKLIDLTTLTNTQDVISRNNIQYVIENDSTKLPVIGKVKLGGLSIQDAEKFLEQAYSKYYVDPFVIMRVINKRVIVFPGTGSAARVITLTNNNTTLIETIALAGGLSQNGKAYRIKLIRGSSEKPSVFLLDLSTIEGIKQANLVVQGNDIIYVEPKRNYSREILNEATPVLSLVSTLLLVYGLIIR